MRGYPAYNVLLVVGLLILVCVRSAFAAPVSLSMTELRALNFKSILKKNNGNVRVKMDADSNNITTGNNNDYIIDDNFKSGRVRIFGSDDSADTINITFTSCGLTGDNIRIRDFRASYGGETWTVNNNGPSTKSGLKHPRGQGRVLKYGSDLIVRSSASTGPLTACYDIDIQYDCAPGCTTDPALHIDRNALVTVFRNIELLGGNSLDFGRITKPTVPSVVRVRPNGNTQIIAGDAVLIDAAPSPQATFFITAQENESIFVSAQFLSAPAGLTMDTFRARYEGTTRTVDTPKKFTAGLGEKMLTLGANLNVDPTVASGSHIISYTLTVDYE